MNNFTKDELMNILYALEHLYEPSFDLPKMYLLRNKVESMIDNYCEHQFAFYISPYGNVVRCQQCNKRIPE